MDVRRLELLLALSRLGSMREVADELGTTTSTVSQQLAALAREAGTALLEPDGRRVRLTPAGERLADHAVTILAAVESARADLDPSAEPAGNLRVGGFATAVRRSLLPALRTLAADHPRVRLLVSEFEPAEAHALLLADDLDLALTYDYDLAPMTLDRALVARPLWSAPWALGVPGTATDGAEAVAGGGTAAEVVARVADAPWIVNSRGTADEDVVRMLAATAGFVPDITHRADSLDLVQELVATGLGVALLPADQPVRPGVRLLPLRSPGVALRAYAVTRAGRADWPPLALLLRTLAGQAEAAADPTGPG
ncbi:LysR family transcriptional regulator [Nocardioides alkalitolerans]|uniref:LysR family transcriptional regulator n=1 Tax=Nocardioides alkalitolerans TaxID=281714 RepID=UPI0003F4DA13|nr:LysR family transcriptional regulator [Nocardioides alkalitolerans]